jgi:tRNA-guanine family transglycosylase
MRFTLNARCGKARAGVVDTAHGSFETPAFMPCGTQAAVKALEPRELREAGIVSHGSDGYILTLSGQDLLKRLSDLQAFAGKWQGSQVRKSIPAPLK